MSTDSNVSKLTINILDKDEYDDLSTKDSSQLYVVKEDSTDSDNALASRTYADVGREAVVSQASEPTSPNTKIWIDTDDEVVYVTPASNDLDNLTTVGLSNLRKLISPDFSSGFSYSTLEEQTFTLTSAGWLYISLGNSSELILKKDDLSGISLVNISTEANTKTSTSLFLDKNTVIYVDTRSGIVDINFYPCKGIL